VSSSKREETIGGVLGLECAQVPACKERHTNVESSVGMKISMLAEEPVEG
jgi:hypothetical protein